MVDYKIDNDDLLRLLNSYKEENNYLKAQNEELRGEIAELKRQLANKPVSKQKYDEALELLRKNNFDGAIKLCNEAINALELNPNLAEAYYSRGNAYEALKQYDKAIDDYNKALELNPNYTEAYNNRGNAYYDLKQYDAAIANYNKAIEVNPNYAEAYFNRGLTYHRLENHREALENFDKYTKLVPNDYAGWQMLRKCRNALDEMCIYFLEGFCA